MYVNRRNIELKILLKKLFIHIIIYYALSNWKCQYFLKKKNILLKLKTPI